jgi:hypothetical protein
MAPKANTQREGARLHPRKINELTPQIDAFLAAVGDSPEVKQALNKLTKNTTDGFLLDGIEAQENGHRFTFITEDTFDLSEKKALEHLRNAQMAKRYADYTLRPNATSSEEIIPSGPRLQFQGECNSEGVPLYVARLLPYFKSDNFATIVDVLENTTNVIHSVKTERERIRTEREQISQIKP